MSTRVVSTAINHEKGSHKFKFSVIVKNMYEHKVVGPINQVKNYEDAREEVESHLKINMYQVSSQINNVSRPSSSFFALIYRVFCMANLG